MKEIKLWGHEMEQNFQNLLGLVPDPSVLGNELMNMVSKLAITEKSTPKAGKSSIVVMNKHLLFGQCKTALDLIVMSVLQYSIQQWNC